MVKLHIILNTEELKSEVSLLWRKKQPENYVRSQDCGTTMIVSVTVQTVKAAQKFLEIVEETHITLI